MCCVSSSRLLKCTEVPSYVREISISTGYRDTLSYKDCVKSIFRLHNETVNIWSHLAGFVYFLYLLHQNFTDHQPHNRTSIDVLAVGIQLCTYQACMLGSSLFHTFLCHSEGAKHQWQQIDHAGILLALWGTYTRIIVTNFSCFPAWQCCHLAAVSTLFALVFYKKWQASQEAKGGVQLYLFLALAVYAVAPFAHWISISPSLLNHGVTAQKLVWLLFPYCLGGLGLFFYTSRVPECFCSQGTYDVLGASHQIWHMLILAGMVSWYELTCWLSADRPLSCQLVPTYAYNTTMLAGM